ncbi:nuclear transport factor 2 family protein [Flexithrix dorotheae]|uniref:nuclear transport factor 2 family protein n=1 Tax=Flexithrix dorotheae TaxID=70993 RepID=UPI0012FA6D99|nr:nuclear transport factor 2 family protein [Flexithrix dorotheae]
MMKCLCIVVLLVISQSCSFEKKNTTTSLDKEIEILTQKINEFNQAFNTADLEKLEQMVTENYLHTNGNSKPIRKETWLNYLKKRKRSLESGELKIENYQMTETEIEMYDDMAIVSTRISFISNNSGTEKEQEFRVTNIWVKEGNDWKRAGFHDYRIK